jgi:hypothetical protein
MRPLRQGFVEGWPASHLYIEDRMAGCRNVYTVWRVPMTGLDRLAHVIGRELPIKNVHRVIKRDQETLR